MVSMIFDYARERVPIEYWTRPALDEFNEVIRRLEEIDRKLNQPDCHDPKKAKWMEKVEERLKALEAGPAKKRK